MPTLLLSLTSLVFAVFLGGSMGLRAARRKDSLFDRFFSNLSYMLDAMPSFWFALMLMLVFATAFKLLPTAGMVDVRASYRVLNGCWTFSPTWCCPFPASPS